MSTTPLVSILMNCYNGEKYLDDAINSVIGQTYSNWELVFWDNQSVDSSKEIIESYCDKRIKYFFAPCHTDLGTARAEASKYFRGDYIAILDADDVWMPEKLEKQLCLFNDPDVGIVISDTLFFNEIDERPLYDGKYPPEGYVFRELLTSYFVSFETLMLRRSIVEKLAYGFDPDFSFIADFDLVLRVAQISKLSICRDVLSKWRVHESSDTWQSFSSFAEEREKWIKKQINFNSEVDFSTKYQSEISILHNNNLLGLAFTSLMLNKRREALGYIVKTRFNKWRNYAILCLCFIPLAHKLLQSLQKRRIKRLLR